MRHHICLHAANLSKKKNNPKLSLKKYSQHSFTPALVMSFPGGEPVPLSFPPLGSRCVQRRQYPPRRRCSRRPKIFTNSKYYIFYQDQTDNFNNATFVVFFTLFA